MDGHLLPLGVLDAALDVRLVLRLAYTRRVAKEATLLAVLEEAAGGSRLQGVGTGDGSGEVVQYQYVRMSNHRIAVTVGTDRYQSWWLEHRQRRTQKEIAAVEEARTASECVR